MEYVQYHFGHGVRLSPLYGFAYLYDAYKDRQQLSGGSARPRSHGRKNVYESHSAPFKIGNRQRLHDGFPSVHVQLCRFQMDDKRKNNHYRLFYRKVFFLGRLGVRIGNRVDPVASYVSDHMADGRI